LAPFLARKIEDVCSDLARAISVRLQQELPDGGDDLQLAGYLQLLHTSITIRPDLPSLASLALNATPGFDLVAHLCDELYGIKANEKTAGTQGRRCGAGAPMRWTVRLLATLAKHSQPLVMQIFPQLLAFHDAMLKSTLRDPGKEVGRRAAGGYVGLQNFGCTCYMNSLFQQLYMIPEFRYKMLRLSTDTLATADCDRVGVNLQKLFASLLLSKDEYCAPGDFCAEFKGFDGKPVNVHIQQDVDEFMNLVLEKLESELRVLNHEEVLHETLGIQLLHQITSLESDTEFTSETTEQVTCLLLDIKGRNSIDAALDAFLQGERLDGDNKYFYQPLDRKVAALKRCLLGHLSNTVIINLKRFDYDYAAMTKKKLNDYCEFPLHINFYKYTKDGQTNPLAEPPRNYDYDLVGVLIHSGTAEGGHYYSFIKEREVGTKNYGKWFEFNDTRVEPFNPEELKKRAFGREKGEARVGGLLGNAFWDSSANAYILIYERPSITPITKEGTLDKFTATVKQRNDELANVRIVTLSCMMWVVSE
jgi:ubiquitin C-terminal hydrolase